MKSGGLGLGRVTIFLQCKRRTGSLRIIKFADVKKSHHLHRCPIFRPKPNKDQKKGHHLRRRPIIGPKSSEN